MNDPSAGWLIERHTRPAAALHAMEISDEPVPTLWVLDATAPALVLGSTQHPGCVDQSRLAAAGIDLAQRRSGGGAVSVIPQRCTWIDLIVPSDHWLWESDVGRATYWVGDLWVRALSSLGFEAVVHRGPMVRTEWSSLICFAGVGPGEVLDPIGRKLVGVSQRRTRAAARFQTVVYHHLDPAEIVELLALDDGQRDAARDALDRAATSADVDPRELIDQIIAQLPRALPHP